MIVYYGDPSCEPCRETKQILDNNGIHIDVFNNVQGLPEYEGQTPILVVDGEEYQGKEAILAWLDTVR